MVHDPFLEAHRVETLVYLAVGHPALGMIGQMLRGQILVERMAAAGAIARERPLLVVGATALGVTAAISAADAGIPVTLIEQEPVLFPSIHLTREILGPSPEEWPYTTSLPRFPLSTETGEGKDIAVVWTNQIGQFIKRNHLLAVSCSRRVSAMEFIPRSSHPYGVDAVRVSFDREGTDLVAGAILWAQDLRWQDEVREIRQGYEGGSSFRANPPGAHLT